jgi:phage gp37-like protein
LSYTITEIEDAIVAQLKASDLIHVCKTIDSYGGELDDLITEAETLIIPFPVTLALFSGSIFDEVANRSFDEELTFTMVNMAKSLRSRAQVKTGIYEILEIEKAVLKNNNLGLNIEPLHPKKIEAILSTKIFSIYTFDFKTSQSLD